LSQSQALTLGLLLAKYMVVIIKLLWLPLILQRVAGISRVFAMSRNFAPISKSGKFRIVDM